MAPSMTLRVARYACHAFCSSQYNQVPHVLTCTECQDVHVPVAWQDHSAASFRMQVLEWCPKNNLVRKVLGAIKVPSDGNPAVLSDVTAVHHAYRCPCPQLETLWLGYKGNICFAQAYTQCRRLAFCLQVTLSRAKSLIFFLVLLAVQPATKKTQSISSSGG